MKRFKDLSVCISILQGVQRRNDIGPEQKKNVEGAIGALKRLSRKSHLNRRDIFQAVSEITERLLEAFIED